MIVWKTLLSNFNSIQMIFEESRSTYIHIHIKHIFTFLRTIDPSETEVDGVAKQGIIR